MSKKVKEHKLHNPETYKTLVVSTGHISKRDNGKITRAAKMGKGSIFIREYGFLVKMLISGDSVKENIQFNKEHYKDFPSLAPVIEDALQLGCNGIEIDRDGPEYEALPAYDW